MPIATVLLYNLSDDTSQGRAVRRLCAQQKLRIRGVLPAQQALPLAALLSGALPEAEAPEQPFTDPVLVMAYLSPAAQNRLLRGLRSLPPIPLKAILTDTNSRWTGVQLHAELCREHAALHGERDPL